MPLIIMRKLGKTFEHFDCILLQDSRVETSNFPITPSYQDGDFTTGQKGREPPGAPGGLGDPPQPHQPTCSARRQKPALEAGVKSETRFCLSFHSPTNRQVYFIVTHLPIKTFSSPPPRPIHKRKLNSAAALNQFKCQPTHLHPGC